MRSEWVELENKLMNLSEIYTDITKLHRSALKVYNKCMLHTDMGRNVFGLFEAKSYLEYCLSIMKSLVESDTNEIIEHYKQSNSFSNTEEEKMEKWFDSFLSDLDAKQAKLIMSLEDRNMESKLKAPALIQAFMRQIMEILETIVLLPLSISLKIYMKRGIEKHKELIRDNKVISKRKIFDYFLFRQILNASKIKGGEKRQKTSISSGSQNATFQEVTNIRQGKPRKLQEIPTIEKEEETDEENEKGDLIDDDFGYEDF